MGAIRLHRVSVLRPFTDFLTDIGASVDRGFHRAGLPVTALEDVNNHVPSQRFLAFVADMAQREGIEDLGFHVGHRLGANSVDPHLAGLLGQSPTLFQAILRFCDLANKTVSNSRMGLLQPPLSPQAYFYHRPSCDDRHPAIEQIGWFGLTTMMGVVDLFAGPHWQPSEIGLIQHHLPDRVIREQYPYTRFRLAQQQSYIVVENALLDLPPLGPQATATASSPFSYESCSDDFPDALKQLLLSYIREKDLTMDFVADLCNMSTRSLHRKLAAFGTRYSEVLEQTRYHVASRMLQDPDTRVTDVAHTLGYTDASHFSRAFRRVAGICPKQYRQQIHH
jgi:AraC-like DNA-binding protein